MEAEKKLTAQDVLKWLPVLAEPKVWSFATFFGGLLFVLYYYHIEYMPELDMGNLPVLLFAAALAGIFIIFAFSIIFVLPSIVWRLWVDGTGEQRYKRLDFSARQKEDWKNLFYFFVSPFLPVMGALIIYVYMRKVQNWSSWPPYVELALILISGGLLVYGTGKNKLTSLDRLCYMTGWCISWLFFILPLYIIIAMIPQNMQAGIVNLLIVVGIILDCILINMAAVKLSSETPKDNSEIVRRVLGIFALGAVMPVVLFSIFGAWSSIPCMVMRAYAFGDKQNVAIVINDEGKKIIEQIGADTKYSESLKGNRVAELTLLSRLGQEYLFCKGQCQAPYQKDDLRFTLPKSTVLSITWKEKDAKGTQ